jgi:hypothetical protein
MLQTARAQTLPDPSVNRATDGIISAFQSHPLVGLGDWHGLAQEEDFFSELIRYPHFARDVGNVVVEFGGAAQQSTLDRYEAGEDIPYDQLRKVWTETIGWIPTVTLVGYMDFFAQVRAVNLTLPANQRIRVWLGDPPIDWSKISSRDDAFKVLHQREHYPATLIKEQILEKHKKALVIYGTFHFYDKDALRALVEEDHPNAFFIVTPYIGFLDKGCSEKFESTIHNLPTPALLSPVKATSLQSRLQAAGCRFMSGNYNFAPDVTEADKEKALKAWEFETSGITGDALLYLGPAAALANSPSSPDLYLDQNFFNEISRRRRLMSGKPLKVPPLTVTPTYLHPYGGPEEHE